MSVKTGNIFEQHVEKVVLAVAAAGAAFMGYLAIQKITIQGTEIGPNDVQNEISAEIDKMDAAGEKISALGKPVVKIPDYVSRWREITSGQPLEKSLVALQVPLFGPTNMSPSKVSIDPSQNNLQIVTPRPVAPEMITAEAWQQLVSTITPPPPAAPGQPAPAPVAAAGMAPMRDQNAALIQGYIPVGAMRVELESQKGNARINADNMRQAIVYRIRVQRRESTPNGWTDFVDVKPTHASPAPTDVDWKGVAGDDMPTKMAQVDAEFQQIVLPDFYLDGQLSPIKPPVLAQPIPKTIGDENKKLREEHDQARMGPATPRTGTGFNPTPLPGAGGGGLGAPAATDVMPSTPDAIKAEEVIPFAFWDETVQPDHTYQYQVAVDFVNPTYQWSYGLKDPAMKEKPLLTSGWVTIPNPVVIHSDTAFFVMGAGAIGGGNGADVRVFKKNEGKWYWSEITTQAGMNIAGQIAQVDKPGTPNLDVNTNYLVVDVQPARDGNNVHVVLKDPSGNLVTRDSDVDRTNPQNDDLLSKAAKRGVTTAPATGPGAGQPTPAPTSPTTPAPFKPAPLPPFKPTPLPPFNGGAPTTPTPPARVPVNPPRTPVQPGR